MKHWFAVLVLCSACAFAQQPPAKGSTAPAQKPASTQKKPAAAEDSLPASAEDVTRLLDAMQLRRQMENTQRAMLGQYKSLVDKMAGGELKDMTPQERQKVNQIVQDMVAEQLKAYPLAEMLADIVPIYQKYLTKGDVRHIAAFYESPAGRKLLDKQPEITRDLMSQVMPKMSERIQASMRRMQERLQELARERRAQPAAEREFKPAAPAPAATPQPSPTPPPK